MLDLKLKAGAYTALILGIFVGGVILVAKFALIFFLLCIFTILGLLLYSLYLSIYFHLSEEVSKDSTEIVVESENDSLQASE